LGLYFVFFGVIFFYVQFMSFFSRNNTSPEKVDAIIKFKTMNNYEYTYVLKTNILDKAYTVDVSGIRYADKDTFEISNYDFYVENNIIYSNNHSVDVETLLPIDLLMLRPEKLYSALEYSIDREVVQYQNGDEKAMYKVPVNYFNAAFLQGFPDSSEMIEITTYESDNQIYKVELDIYNLMKLVNAEFGSYTVVIEYSNIDNIKGVEN